MEEPGLLMSVVNREFLSTIGDLMMDCYEISHSRLRGREMDPCESASCGIFLYTYNDFFISLEVFGEKFRWSTRGNLISGPVKTFGEWTEWLNATMLLFNRSLQEEAAA